ncbi:HlyD family secretion protein [Prosthecobacter fusiformis]|uniref:HlyD family secretion protein n=1 Tax=Prosthecobacter fusiformis TaxID=48464 RepID=A0A4R7SSF0_9BACT|nr:efflux RND transporter periplasmic adaptor subunit [Prosthecobacter fusiformis]TDU81108.1 HlyD family secretion protein [Prosthecobacter fusiformis]
METLTATPSDDLSTLIGVKKTRSSLRWIAWTIGLVALMAAGYFVWSKMRQPAVAPLAYVTEPLNRGDISLTITATGNLEPTNEVTIGSVLSGNAEEVYVDINDRVKQGQELAKITIRRLEQDIDNSRAAVNSSKAKVSQVQATLTENEASLARLQELHKLSGGRTPSKADMVTATAAVARANADLGSAKASVEQAEAELKANESDQANAVLRSPIDGIVLTRSLEPGQTVAASFTAPELFVIAENLEHMKLKVAVAEADIGRVAKDQKSTFTVDAWPERTYSAKVTRVSYGSAVTDNVVTYETELEVSNKDLSLRPGMTATADIHVAQSENVLIVPTAALRFDPSVSSSHPAMGGGEKKSFVQSLIPSPRRSGSGGPRPPGDSDGPAPSKGKSGRSQIWVLRDGQPVAVPVTVGLSDGRFTEISGEELSEGMAVITRANSIPKP